MIEYIKLTLLAALGEKWDYYQRTVEYAEKLRAISTGEGYDTLLKRFVQREDETMFEQRVEFTKVVTPAVCNRIKVPFNKALRSDDVMVRFEPVDKISEVSGNYFAGLSVSQYLDQYCKDHIFIDPNAHLICDFDPFNANVSKAQPYPILYESEYVLFRTETKTGLLDALVVDADTGIICYTRTKGVKLTPIEKPLSSGLIKDYNKAMIESLNVELPPNTVLKVGTEYYELTYFEPKLNGLHQAIRVGYILDPNTKGKTVLSPIHPAINRLEKTIKTASELDLTMCLHAFPQKIMQREVCSGHKKGDAFHRCNAGTYYDKETDRDSICPNCNGTGYEPVHKTAQDVVIVPLAKNREDQLDLDNMVKYVEVDTDTPKFQNEYLQQLEEQCVKDVFASNTFSMQNQKTATEVQVNYDSVYDAIFPFTQHFSKLWEHTVRLRSKILSIEPTEVLHIFPPDPQLKSLAELVQEYKASEGAPDAVRLKLAKAIIDKSHSGDIEAKRKYMTRLELQPYATKSSEDVQFIIASQSISAEKLHLWANFNDVMNAVELANPTFYELERSAQIQIVAEMNRSMMPVVNLQLPVDGQ